MELDDEVICCKSICRFFFLWYNLNNTIDRFTDFYNELRANEKKGEFNESKKSFIGIIMFRHVDAFCDACISGVLFES